MREGSEQPVFGGCQKPAPLLPSYVAKAMLIKRTGDSVTEKQRWSAGFILSEQMFTQYGRTSPQFLHSPTYTS